MDIFEIFMPNEYALHDKLPRHTAYTSFLVLGMLFGVIAGIALGWLLGVSTH